MKYLVLTIVAVVLVSCNGNSSNESADDSTNQVDNSVNKSLELYGNTQGTTYAILCNDPIALNKQEVDNMLHDFDMALSSYVDSSILTLLNNLSTGEYTYDDPYAYFNRCYEMAMDVYAETKGAFDPTVYPLVDGWGFMKNVENVPDSAVVDSLRALVGFDNGYHFEFNYTVSAQGDTVPASSILKRTPGAKLDFNAIAQGLAVDVLAEELEERGVQNYFVEIGGEIRVKGVNSEGELWRIGIDKPIENSTEETRVLQEVVHVDNRSIATSGSYRKFYEKNGIKYSHTLDPKTGYPVRHSLLSATVVAPSCAIADAMATAFMVMGPEKAIAYLENNNTYKLDAYLIFINEHDEYETYYTTGFGDMIIL